MTDPLAYYTPMFFTNGKRNGLKRAIFNTESCKQISTSPRYVFILHFCLYFESKLYFPVQILHSQFKRGNCLK